MILNCPRINTVSCASCHELASGGADGRKVSLGIEGKSGVINAPTVFNVGLNFKQFWDGRANSLEAQIDGPIQSADEMGSLWPEVVSKLYRNPRYPGMFDAIYTDGINRKNVKDAIAEFMRSLITPNSAFDKWLKGDDKAIGEQEKRGYILFKEYGCVSCHQGSNVGGNMFQVFGILNDYFKKRGNITEADLGRYNITGNDEDRHAFKVPSLRMAAMTPPYLHDGSAKTLRDAVDAMFEFQLGREAPDEDRDANRCVHQDASWRIQGVVPMNSSAVIFGTIVSIILLGAAGALYLMADDHSDQHYRKSVNIVRQIQLLSSEWSMEITRVKSDPFADFDSLAAFTPRITRLKESLTDIARQIPRTSGPTR